MVDMVNAFRNKSPIFVFHHIAALALCREMYYENIHQEAVLRVYVIAECSNILIYPIYILLHSPMRHNKYIWWIKLVHFCNYSFQRIVLLMWNAYDTLCVIDLNQPFVILALVVYVVGIVWSGRLALQLLH